MENVMTGLVVMVIGMAVVYAFLTIMILVMNLSAKAIQILNKYFPEPIEEKKPQRKKLKQMSQILQLLLRLLFKRSVKNAKLYPTK